jgi:hypothetical protein
MPVVLLVLVAVLGLMASDVWARGRAGRARPRIDRSGPAAHGSFGRSPATYRRSPPPRDPGPDRPREARPDPEPLATRREFDAPIPVRAERIDEVEDRRDYVRRHRAWRLGTRLSYDEWVEYDCDDAELIEVDGDQLFECEGTWFVQTYYGGDVVYTATDPPSE